MDRASCWPPTLEVFPKVCSEGMEVIMTHAAPSSWLLPQRTLLGTPQRVPSPQYGTTVALSQTPLGRTLSAEPIGTVRQPRACLAPSPNQSFPRLFMMATMPMGMCDPKLQPALVQCHEAQSATSQAHAPCQRLLCCWTPREALGLMDHRGLGCSVPYVGTCGTTY